MKKGKEKKEKKSWQQPKSQSIARTTKPSAIAKTRVTSGVITGRLRFLSRRLFFLSFSQSCSSRKFITREREKKKGTSIRHSATVLIATLFTKVFISKSTLDFLGFRPLF
ncbi:hypothetical protein CEXT_450771 [Caerostris extrusa]|uniref:Uncharacterized protein n=1 Tax=Caerostris extrusa TaxID=172846 RepID=A0AAV4WGM7_CAEEX|nr:hypothetical protein CEXT_450771 [Caerostris extrusa]